MDQFRIPKSKCLPACISHTFAPKSIQYVKTSQKRVELMRSVLNLTNDIDTYGTGKVVIHQHFCCVAWEVYLWFLCFNVQLTVPYLLTSQQWFFVLLSCQIQTSKRLPRIQRHSGSWFDLIRKSPTRLIRLSSFYRVNRLVSWILNRFFDESGNGIKQRVANNYSKLTSSIALFIRTLN